ncbi:hypothetical protein CDAR_376911 [Caerostris darwini]|uniref:Uncharacterized protein n=1 Tax=Caerostris darwini TaxID=1538125 RepID=A0AAV4SUQ0_9ARAC|nr:hypothetical protein CDAR_376911 [Caerostris darwini]
MHNSRGQSQLRQGPKTPLQKASPPLVGPNPLKPSSSSLECLFLLRAIPGIIPASSGQKGRLLGRGDKKRHGLSPLLPPGDFASFHLAAHKTPPFLKKILSLGCERDDSLLGDFFRYRNGLLTLG